MWSRFSATCSGDARNYRGTKASPENLTSTFKLYRNLDALYECSNRWLSRRGHSDPRTSSSRWKTMSALSRRAAFFADRMETLAGAKELEVTRLRAALQRAQASVAVAASQEDCGGRHRAGEETGQEEACPQSQAHHSQPQSASPTAAPSPK